MTERLLQIIRLLDSDNGKKDVIENILEGTNEQETNIIEFKATAFRPQNVKNEKGGTKEDDYKWNVLKAIIAFANTSGGVVFVGIKEDKALHKREPYQLFLKNGKNYKDIQNQNSDDMDEYIRAINERILQKTRFETTPDDSNSEKKEQNVQDSKENNKKVVYQLTSAVSRRIQTLTTISAHTFRNHTVFAIRVSPGEYSEKLRVKKDNSTVFFVRGTAQVDALTDYDEIESYKRPVPLVFYDSMPLLHGVPAPCERFVGRDKELEDLHNLLSPNRKNMRKIPVLIGPVGIGKSQLAYKYCEQYRKDYPSGSDIKISGENMNCTRDILLALAEEDAFLSRFNITFSDDERKKDPQAEERRVDKVKRALFDEKHDHILIYLKNVDNPSRLFLDDNLFRGPCEDFVHVLATSSHEQEWDSDINENDLFIPYEVKPLTEQEGMELLFQWRPFIRGGAEEKAALGIVRILEGHTGRLADAGKRLKKTYPAHDNDYADLLKKLEINPDCVQDDIEFDAIRDRIRQAVTGGVGGQNQSICSIGRPISKSFVGRLEELKKLNELVFKPDENSGNTLKQIPVITGDAGVGKTELAVAYAYVFADKFPQGRFLIPMQGVTSWADAMTKLLECCDNCGQDPIDLLGLPENFSKLPSEEKRNTVYRTLSRRARKGALLLLLDNLEDMRLISENDGLRELPGALPMNLHMIATTRLNETSSSSVEMPTLFEINNLKEKDALELFCKICDKVFPFADYPFEDGKLSIDLISEEKRPGPEKIESIERDYGVLRDIIRLLDRHAWSVEIVAGRIAFKSKRMKIDIQKEWAGLHDNLIGNLTGKTYRSAGNKAENLLQQTFDLILKQDELVEGLGQRIMRLAEIASFFPPDQIPEYALRQIWIEQFGDEEISFEQDGMPLTGSAYEYAVNQLIMFRITGGKEPMFKMHRLTRGVLHNRLTEDEKLEIIRLMRKCLDDYLKLKNKTDQTSLFLQTWCAWGDEWTTALPVLRKDATFMKSLWGLAGSLNNYAIQDLMNHSYEAAEKGLSEALKLYSKQPSNSPGYSYIGTFMANLSLSYKARRHYKEAESELINALNFYRNLMEENPEEYTSYYAHMLIALASLYDDTKRFQEAERKYGEALAIFQKLAEKNPEKHSGDLAELLRRLADYHSDRLHFDEAEKEYRECLEIYRKLVHEKPEIYSYDFACTLHNSANNHSELNKYEDAECEYSEALAIFRKLAENTPQIHKGNLAMALVSYASFLSEHKSNYTDALSKYTEGLSVLRELAGTNPALYNSKVASCLCDIGFVYCRLKDYPSALSTLSEALEIYRNLTASNSQYNAQIANTLCHLAKIHANCNQTSSAYSEYKEALDIYRELAISFPTNLDPTIAMVLGELGELHLSSQRFNEAESAFSESLAIYRKLEDKKTGAFSIDIILCLERLADCYTLTESYEKAKSAILEARDILEKEKPQNYNDISKEELQHKISVFQRMEIRKKRKKHK